MNVRFFLFKIIIIRDAKKKDSFFISIKLELFKPLVSKSVFFQSIKLTPILKTNLKVCIFEFLILNLIIAHNHLQIF